MSDLTIVIPVKNPKKLDEWLQRMEWLLKEQKTVVIDSGGESGTIYAQICGEEVATSVS